MSHTKEPWAYDNNVKVIHKAKDRYEYDEDGNYLGNQWNDICTIQTHFNYEDRKYATERTKANAQRIVSCVNAMAGIEDPEDWMKSVIVAVGILSCGCCDGDICLKCSVLNPLFPEEE